MKADLTDFIDKEILSIRTCDKLLTAIESIYSGKEIYKKLEFNIYEIELFQDKAILKDTLFPNYEYTELRLEELYTLINKKKDYLSH